MDQYSILDRKPSAVADEADAPPVRGAQIRPATISAQIAAANAVLTRPSDTALRFPGEDYGRSLAQLAHADLDAALQLLADRAQYITGASGAAIALRRGQHKDMLCRASAGWNAPQPGALLSMEYGLSGESVRTRQLLCCDDAEHDPRVNREVCRELRIVSVVIVPILSDDQVLGVFELFSGKPRAFEERDISALLRLSEMVETAVKYAVAAQGLPEISDAPMAQGPGPGSVPVPSPVKSVPPQPLPTKPIPVVQPMAKRSLPEQPKPLLWSAAMRAQSAPAPEESTPGVAVPPVLRRLQKCQACGFPVSQGRTFCIECEDKQWRGQALARSMAVKPPQQNPVATAMDLSRPQPDFASNTVPLPAAPLPAAPQAAIAFLSGPVPIDASLEGNPTVFNSALPAESWFASNKYVLGALFVVAAILGAITWLR